MVVCVSFVVVTTTFTVVSLCVVSDGVDVVVIVVVVPSEEDSSTVVNPSVDAMSIVVVGFVVGWDISVVTVVDGRLASTVVKT